MYGCKYTVDDAVLDPDELYGNIFRNLVGPACLQRDNPVANLKLTLGLYLLPDNSCSIGVASIGALYLWASFGIAPIWSRCP